MTTTSCRARGCHPQPESLGQRKPSISPGSPPFLLVFQCLHSWNHSIQPGRPQHNGSDRYTDGPGWERGSRPCYPLLLWPGGKKGWGPQMLPGGKL